MRLPVHDEPLAAIRLADLRSVGAVVVDDLGEQVGGAVGAAQATCPLFRVILPADRLAGANAKHDPLEVNDLGLSPLNLGRPASALRERRDALGSAGLAARTPELNVNHLRLRRRRLPAASAVQHAVKKRIVFWDVEPHAEGCAKRLREASKLANRHIDPAGLHAVDVALPDVETLTDLSLRQACFDAPRTEHCSDHLAVCDR